MREGRDRMRGAEDTSGTTGTALSRRRVLGLGAGAFVAVGSGALGTLFAGCSGGEEAAAPETAGRASAARPASGASAPSPETDTGTAPEATAEAGAPSAPAAAGGGDAKLVTAYPANEPLVRSLQYVHESQKSDQLCSNCFFYSGKEEGLGSCQLFQRGLVKAGGWCSSWQAKPA